ncbi:MAG: flagellar basal body P-ring protein FlgI [Desulfocapsaceae bacterium]|nr:flagellar basal body P-ring protein FlgI [Desulfocapsaceae bacterium]
MKTILFATGIFCFMFVQLFFVQTVSAARIKDIAKLNGVRSNQLIGYGLVTGLSGTGDDMKNSLFTLQSVNNMLVRNGITIDPAQISNVKIKNVAAVMVTADLPPFAKPGSTIDVEVSSMGDAKSLAGGTLIMTPLKGVDHQVYAVAQGPLTIGAFSFAGKTAKAQKNQLTVGRIPNGALIENTVPFTIGENGTITYQLENADFTTADRISKVINQTFGQSTAEPTDSGTVKVTIPRGYRSRIVDFVASVESLNVETDSVARVVVDERTGTIVMGKEVKLSTFAVSHGNLSLVVKETPPGPLQPNPLENGPPAPAASQPASPPTGEEGGELTVLNMPKGVSIGEIANALNSIGATPRDLIAIFQAIKASGAMQGELIVL